MPAVKTNRPLSEASLGGQRRFRTDPLINGRQDFRRSAGKELAWFQQAIGHRDEYPINIMHIGNSFTENFGVTDDYHAWTDLFRSAIQNRYRNGGVGYIASKHAQTITWPYTTNPDGKNTWAFTTGTQFDDVDYGFGFGNRNTLYNNAAAKQITIDCDRFWIVYTNFAATMTIDVDAGTPFALTTTQSTAAVTNGPTLSGRIFDSQVAFGTLPLGTHTVKVTSTTSTIFHDGIMVFYTDGNSGVHVWNGGHSGYFSSSFDGTTTAKAMWADLFHQPYLPTGFNDGVGNGTTTFTSATATFTDLDIGSYILLSAGTSCTNGMARIVARASGTSVTLDRVVASGSGLIFEMNRAQFTDGVTTINTKTLTSATAAFNPWDVGVYITGPTSVPAGTYIARYDSPTQVQMSQAATASQSAQTVRFMGRQKFWCAPDLMTVEFGVNDMHIGLFNYFKTDIRNIVSLASERVGLGFPVGFPQRYTPSVVLLGVWAPAGLTPSYSCADLTATSGQKQISSNTIDFDPSDVGKTISSPSNTPIGAGNTIASVQDNLNATLTNNAVATTAGTGTAIITNRTDLEKFWMPYRTAMFELAAENTWRFFDLYSLGGYIGTNDPLNLTYDLTHPNNHGAKWIADELDILITGQPRSGPIPVGVFDAKGDWLMGTAPDNVGKGSAGIDGQSLAFSSTSPLGAQPMDNSSQAPFSQVLPTQGGSGAVQAMGCPAPTLTATASTTEDSLATWLTSTTSTTSGNPSGIVSAAFTITRAGRLPEFQATVRTGSAITTVQYAIGLSSATLDANPPAASSAGAYFRYNTTSDGTAFWRTCTSDATTIKTFTTTAAIAVSTVYNLRIVVGTNQGKVVGVRGTSVGAIDFYINGVLVATHTVNLPAVATALGYGTRVMTLTTAARVLDQARIGISSGP